MKNIDEKELKEYRYLFPVCKKWIYLNHAAVAPISIRVADAVMLYNQEALQHGYTQATHWQNRITKIRELCSQLVHCTSEEIAFVKNTSHGISLIARGLNFQPGDEIIISNIEFPANVYPWMALENQGVQIKKITSHQGELQLDNLEKMITPKTRLVSLSSVQYSNGYRLPIEKIGKVCRQNNILFFVDAIQSLGAFPINVVKDHIDFLAADAHKWLLGHEGIGLFYIRKELIKQIEPALIGWNSVQNPLDFDHIHFKLKENAERFEEGSHNGLSIYGLGAAVELLLEVGIERIAQRILDLTGMLLIELQDMGLNIHNSLNPQHRSGNIFFSIPEDNDLALLKSLERHLFEKHIYTTIRKGRMRLSPHFYNSEEEMTKTIQEMKTFFNGISKS